MQDWEIAARVGLQKTMTDYVRCVDTGRLDELAALFSEPCHYVMGSGEPLTSRAEILRRGEELRSMFRDSPTLGERIRHHVTPVAIDFSHPGEAKATSYFLTMGRHGPDHWGTYRDVLVHVDGAWLFDRRVAAVEGFAPGSPAALTALTA